MDLASLLGRRHLPHTVLAALFVLYLVMGMRLPGTWADMIDTTAGKVVLGIAALMLFVYGHPVLGVLGLLVAYQLSKSAAHQTGSAALQAYYPTEERKWSPFTPEHQFPYTLEQEMVKKMTTQNFNTTYVKAPFRPVLDNTHGAAMLSAL